MLKKLKNTLSFGRFAVRDWSTKRKIIVIESDDWGSIRMPSYTAQSELEKNGIDIKKCPFLSFDSFEEVEDFDAIKTAFEYIYKKYDKKPVITANYILANPDFERIKDSNFEEYHRKYFWEELKQKKILQSYQNKLNELMEAGYFFPQLHGLEHLQVPYWMKQLNSNNVETLLAFKNGVYGISTTVTKENRDTYLAALNYNSNEELDKFIIPNLEKAYNEFNSFFGYYSKSFIAPNYVWSSKIEKKLSEFGIEIIQSSRYQIFPKMYSKKNTVKFIGEKNPFGQIYLVRNVVFEPSTCIANNHIDLVEKCVNQIELAFKFNTPAIISMHRLNFMGGFSKINRDINLQLLKDVLEITLQRWPQLEFLNSEELGGIIKNS